MFKKCIATGLLITLVGCAPTMFGVKKEDFEQLSESERLAVIQGYNERKEREQKARIAYRLKEIELEKEAMAARAKVAPFEAAVDAIATIVDHKQVTGKKLVHVRDDVIILEDGRRYRAPYGYLGSWRRGDRIVVHDSDSYLYPYLVTNLDRETSVKAEIPH